MGVDDERDVTCGEAKRRKAILETRGTLGATPAFHSVDVVELLRFLAADAIVDKHQADVVLDEQAAHAQLDAVPLVGRDALFPEWLGHDAEHRTAVELHTAS